MSSNARLVERSLQLSVVDGVLYALMLGVSESYFGACAVALGHSDTALAILVTLPLFAGAVAQALTGPLVLALGSRKRLVVTGAVVQALSHLGLIFVAWTGSHALGPLLALVLLYFVSGMVIMPAWGAWMGDLTEQIDRQRYFSLRSAALAVSLLLGFMWGGYHLHAGELAQHVSRAYAALFSVGFVARTASSLMLMLQGEPERTRTGARANRPPPRDSLRRVRARMRGALRGEGKRLVFALALLMFGAHLSIPFYAPYMLKTLALGYDGFALLCGVQLLMKSVALLFMHRVAARVGLAKLLVGAIGVIALVSGIWGAAIDKPTLVFAQMLSGFAWAAYEFASFQLLLQVAKPSHRVEVLAFAASLAGLFQLSGALCGSYLLSHAGFGYRDVFYVSAFVRLLPLVLLVPALAEFRSALAARAARVR